MASSGLNRSTDLDHTKCWGSSSAWLQHPVTVAGLIMTLRPACLAARAGRLASVRGASARRGP